MTVWVQLVLKDPLDAPNAHSGRPCILVNVSFINVRVICLEFTLAGNRGEGDAIECGFVSFLHDMSSNYT
jgi:hypothetical protein